MIEALGNPYFVLAFVITPAVVVAFGWLLVFIHERSLDKHRPTPGE